MTFENFTKKIDDNGYDTNKVLAYEVSRVADALEYVSNEYVVRVVKAMKDQESANNALRDNLNAFSESFKNAVNKNTGTSNKKPDVEIVK